METVNSILVPYLTLVLFSLSVLDHAANFKGASRAFGLTLQVISLVSIIGILTILITVGIHEKWWIPILLAIGGLIISGLIQSFVLRLIGKNNQFVMSLLGIIAIPATLIIILNKILF
jgi:hypothetical protein